MHILDRISLPKSTDISDLYIRVNENAAINYNEFEKKIVFSQGSSISSNSYFNSVYERLYTQYTTLKSIYYLLSLEGDFRISVYREVNEQNNREVIFSEVFEECQLSDYVKVLLPDFLPTETAGRIYFEILCLSKQGLFTEGLIATEQNKAREVSLGIITCTFKKEAYIENTINTILQDKFLESKNFKIFIVDNGRTLDENAFKESKTKLISNKNVGGSGGFTRGLVEAVQENAYSHFLFMDDDIELDSESIYKLFSLYEYAKMDFAVAGSMLDLYKKHLLYEAGALHGRHPITRQYAPFTSAPLKHNLDLQNPTSLNVLLLEDHVDYGGFWFFSFSREAIEKIGFLMPFFIKIDDMEFGLRITKCLGNKIVAFPSIAVWHEPFYAKYPIWDTYYHIRNNLITHAIYGSLGYIKAVKDSTRTLIYYLLVFDYNSAQMIVKAFEDYLKGPDFIRSNEPAVLHSNIIDLSKSYKTQNVQQNYLPPNQAEQMSKAGIFKKILSLLTLNGHLLPNFLTSDDDVFIWHGSGYPGQGSKAFAKKRVLIYKEGSGCLFQNQIDKSAGIKLLTRWLEVVVRSGIKWSSVCIQWRTAANELRSTTFWQQYLGLKK